MGYMGMTYAEHAAFARRHATERGLADCIHYAPNWDRRADALYAIVNAVGHVPGMTLGLLPDGRMVTSAREPLTDVELYCVFEVAT
jgi:hypothetical protein